MPLQNLLSRFTPALNRERRRQERLRQMHVRAALYPGPHAIVVARKLVADRLDLLIDPLETEFRVTGTHVEVRAWLRLPTGQIPAGMYNALTETAQRLEDLPPQSRQIFFLSTAYRLTTAEIADLLGLRRRTVKRALLCAIARRDGRIY